MNEPLENAELLAFTKVVDARSVSRAASELAVPRATIGRRLARLEERLGVRLLRRTTRSLVLTDAGEVLYRQARIALDAVRQAEASVRRSDTSLRGELRISAPPFPSPSFHALVTGFAAAHPEVRLQLHASTQRVDLRRETFDIALRGGSEFEPGLVARVLYRTLLVAVAAPDYLAQAAPLRTPRDLRHHRCLLSFARGELPQTHWTDRKGRKIHVEASFSSNDIAVLRRAALDGLGIAYLPHKMVEPSLRSGQLVQVLKGALETESKMSIVYAEREYLPAQVRAFVDAVIAWAARDGDEGLWPLPVSPAPVAGRGKTKRT